MCVCSRSRLCLYVCWCVCAEGSSRVGKKQSPVDSQLLQLESPLPSSPNSPSGFSSFGGSHDHPPKGRNARPVSPWGAVSLLLPSTEAAPTWSPSLAARVQTQTCPTIQGCRPVCLPVQPGSALQAWWGLHPASPNPVLASTRPCPSTASGPKIGQRQEQAGSVPPSPGPWLPGAGWVSPALSFAAPTVPGSKALAGDVPGRRVGCVCSGSIHVYSAPGAPTSCAAGTLRSS